MNSFFQNIVSKNKSGLHGSAFILALGTFTAQLLGLFRDRLLAQTFGVGASLDVYYAAFRVPDMLYLSFGSLLAVTVLVPFVLREKNAQPLLDTVFTWYLLLMGSSAGVVWLAMPFIAPFIAPGFTPGQSKELIELSRLLLFSPVVLGLSPLLASMLQSRNRFGAYAFAPALYNLGIIVGIMLLAPQYGIRGVVYGVLIGVVLHVGVQFVESLRTGSGLRFSLEAPFAKVLEVAKVSVPRTVTLGISQVLIVVVTALASRIGSGSIALFSFALTLSAIPQALLGLAYATASFPRLTKLWQEGRREDFKGELSSVLRIVAVFSVTVSILAWFFSRTLVGLLLGAGIGRFAPVDADLVSGLFSILALTVMPQGVISLLSRGFFAMTNTRWPLLANLLSGAIALVLMFYWASWGTTGLALAYSLGLTLNGVILLVFMEYRLPGFCRKMLGFTS